MTIFNHTLGFPRIGLHRELKRAQEHYWSGKISYDTLLSIGSQLRRNNWLLQKKSGIDYIPVGDFAWYDHVLTTSMMLGNIPERHLHTTSRINLDCLFHIARGSIPDVSASEMKKWFNTNYHYIVPEFTLNTKFKFSWKQLLDEVDEALLLGYKVKPVLLGPITYLWLGKVKGKYFDRLDMLENILLTYQEILKALSQKKIDFIQIDEPVLVLELPEKWKNAYLYAYRKLYGISNLLLTTYFDTVEHNIQVIQKLPVQGIHIDTVYGKYNLIEFNKKIPKDWMLSLGVINGRNIWRTDLVQSFQFIFSILNNRKKILIGSSCSLLHTPIDLKNENNIDPKIKKWFAFAVQKCTELKLLSNALKENNMHLIKEWSQPIHERVFSKQVHKDEVQKRLSQVSNYQDARLSSYNKRANEQKKKFKFPILPITTIGSFPQTLKIRQLRSNFKSKLITKQEYDLSIKENIKKVIKMQEELDIDVLVHGEFERNDMVEYFSERLNGFISTENGWVQSYGSRCVKPPIIISDIKREKPMTLKWSKYAQSLTDKPVKGMLTGPITMLFWSFPREDIPLEIIAKQIALVLNDEVLELERENINIIQIDEPALREGLPLRKSQWKNYLFWAVNSFRLSTLGIKNTTQIHTHMCYSEFNDIMKEISLLDADVITIETTRSEMKLLEFFENFQYPNEIGPGVYDIHSSNIPSVKSIYTLLKKAIKYIPHQRVWVNPDCGLKTRNWKETILSLKNMIEATKKIRKEINCPID